jgi:AcrR family transcriptional regulator
MPATTFSPNQLDKREQIIEAAKTVLIRDGLRSCTTREVAEESPLTRSAIHYYFDSIDEIVEAAMSSHLDDLISNLRAAGDGIDDPAERFWTVTQAYVEGFRDNEALTLLWWDYSIKCVQEGRRDRVRATEEAIGEVLTELLEDCGVDDSKARSRVLLAYMIGTTMRQIIHQTEFGPVEAELATLSGVPPRPR